MRGILLGYPNTSWLHSGARQSTASALDMSVQIQAHDNDFVSFIASVKVIIATA
jgi:hypothetical protein